MDVVLLIYCFCRFVSVVTAVSCRCDTAVALFLCAYTLGLIQKSCYKQCSSNVCWRFAHICVCCNGTFISQKFDFDCGMWQWNPIRLKHSADNLVGSNKVQDCFDVERISGSISWTVVADDAESRSCYATYRARDTAYTSRSAQQSWQAENCEVCIVVDVIQQCGIHCNLWISVNLSLILIL